MSISLFQNYQQHISYLTFKILKLQMQLLMKNSQIQATECACGYVVALLALAIVIIIQVISFVVAFENVSSDPLWRWDALPWTRTSWIRWKTPEECPTKEKHVAFLHPLLSKPNCACMPLESAYWIFGISNHCHGQLGWNWKSHLLLVCWHSSACMLSNQRRGRGCFLQKSWHLRQDMEQVGLDACRADLVFERWNYCLPTSWNNPDNPLDSTTQTIFLVMVCGLHCSIDEPTLKSFDENLNCYSHKFHGTGLDYEVMMSIFEQKCAHINGPFPAGDPDITVFRSGLKAKLLAARLQSGINHHGLADKGHQGKVLLLSVLSSQDTAVVIEFVLRALSRHETFNCRLKNLDCLDERFRHHDLLKHKQCFKAVAVICQLQL